MISFKFLSRRANYQVTLFLLGVTIASFLVPIYHIIQGNLGFPLYAVQQLTLLPNKYYQILLSIVIPLTVTQIVIRISPEPNKWTRAIVGGIVIALSIRYLWWRGFSTLNLSDLFTSLLSLSLFLMEVWAVPGNILQFIISLGIKNRTPEADKYSKEVIEGKYTPTVDILIPTYNEPDFILKRTIIGCQAIDYPHKNVYILDDTRRPEIKNLAKELDCHYLTRDDNLYAKAGNLNHALSKTEGELVVVFDADFIPTKDFLNRTLGFFQDKSIGLLQTYQSFYNPDPVARNLGLENILPQEAESFSRYYQPLRDSIDSALCYGSSFVVRRSYLQDIGGFVTETLSEDYFTAVCLSAKKYRVIYLKESLSAGLSAENIRDHVQQKLRWARGTLQAFFVKSNPATIPGLSLLQRLAHLEGILQWFTSLFRLVFLVIPLFYLMLSSVPFVASFSDWFCFFLPFYLVSFSTYSWLNNDSRSALISDIYGISQCVPIAITTVQTLVSPFSERFKVTPKGTKRDGYSFNWDLAWPLILLFLLTLVSCIFYGRWLLQGNFAEGFRSAIGLSLIWGFYNLVVIGLSLIIMMDIPKPEPYEWFSQREKVWLTTLDGSYQGITRKISELGVEVICKGIVTSDVVTVELLDGLHIAGKIVYNHNNILHIRFPPLTLPQHRSLIKMLYCRPGQWQWKKTPSELQVIGYLIKVGYRNLSFFVGCDRKHS